MTREERSEERNKKSWDGSGKREQDRETDVTNQVVEDYTMDKSTLSYCIPV